MADLRAALGHALEPAYRVEREVRPVGNCRMFVALEKSAGGGLLVKVLPGALSLAVDSTRFEQEIARLGRRLRHPSLVAPRTAGRVGSFVYHTRTFVRRQPGAARRSPLGAGLARRAGAPLSCRGAECALGGRRVGVGKRELAERRGLIQCGRRNEEYGIDGPASARPPASGVVLSSHRWTGGARSHTGREVGVRAAD